MYIEDKIKSYSSGERLLTQAAFTRGRQAVFQSQPELPLKCLPVSTQMGASQSQLVPYSFSLK